MESIFIILTALCLLFAAGVALRNVYWHRNATSVKFMKAKEQLGLIGWHFLFFFSLGSIIGTIIKVI